VKGSLSIGTGCKDFYSLARRFDVVGQTRRHMLKFCVYNFFMSYIDNALSLFLYCRAHFMPPLCYRLTTGLSSKIPCLILPAM
jgi:hypothetical protein